MGTRRRHRHVQAQVQEWELELLRKVASAFDTPDRQELEAELSRKLLELKAKDLSHVRNWPAYLAKFLYNKASNWVRDMRALKKRTADDPDALPAALELNPEISLDQAAELRLAFAEAWRSLDPKLRRVWAILVEERGNQVRVATRLGVHRNTVRLWMGKIRQILLRQDFGM